MKKKVLFILHFPPPVHGSAVMGLQVKESKLIAASYDCRHVNLGTSITIDEIGRNYLGKIIRYLTILCNVVVNLLRRRPDLCYLAITSKGPAFYKDAVVVALVKLFRVKLIYHFHNKGVGDRQDKPLDDGLYRYVFKNTDAILLSKHLYSDVKKYIPSRRVYYCPNGIPDIVGSNIKKKSREVNATINVLFLSNLLKAKGVYVLLAACKILQGQQLDFHCTFVGGIGDVSAQQFLFEVQKLNLENYVDYVGAKFGDEKGLEFERADIFAFPTLNECFPLVLLEAMQHSLPIIATCEGGIPDIIEDGVSGFLVEKNDSLALANKLAMLIQNKNLREDMGKNGRFRYDKSFTSQHFETKLHEILGQCGGVPSSLGG